jgi:biopolymer transport protein ExbD
MAHIDDGGGGGRNTTVDLNLVPIIDLMSVCIIFLLITAVWTQVSMIQIGSSIYGKKSTDDKPQRLEGRLPCDHRARKCAHAQGGRSI